MNLPSDLVSEFAKVTNDKTDIKQEMSYYGTIVVHNGGKYVKLDGSELLTPIQSTTVVEDGERVIVMLKNRSATVTGNISSPSASNKKVQEIGKQITEFEIVIADKVSTKEFDAQVGRINDLVTDNTLVKNKLTANEAEIADLKAKDVEITGKLTANDAEIDDLKAKKIDADIADLKYAGIEDLDVINEKVHNLEGTYGEFEDLTTKKFVAVEGDILDLYTKKLNAEEAELKYANIDFTNIGKAALEEFFSKSGLIQNVIIGDGIITGNLVGVTIKGDLIEGGTVVADKLVIKGTDGIYYKLNTDGVTTESEQTEYNSLDGSHILTKSITATKIAVDDLVAFGATIGGFKITDNAIYSGVKESVDNTTRGLFLGDDGQIAIGDSNNFLKYYKDTDNVYKLQISAGSIKFSTSNKTVEEEINGVKNDVDSLRDEITTLLRIESSRGTVFKNDNISTVLSAVIYHGSERITDATALNSIIGASAYLQWSWQRLDEDSFGIISSDDYRLGNGGFTFTLSPEDVDTKVTFMCQLIV